MIYSFDFNSNFNNDYDFESFTNFGKDTIERYVAYVDFEDRENYETYEEHEDFEDCEDCEENEEYLLSYDKEVGNDSPKGGDSWCVFTLETYRNFLKFFNFLRRHGFEKMKLRDSKRYKVEVFGLTAEEATLLRSKLLSLGNFVPQHSQGQVA